MSIRCISWVGQPITWECIIIRLSDQLENYASCITFNMFFSLKICKYTMELEYMRSFKFNEKCVYMEAMDVFMYS